MDDGMEPMASEGKGLPHKEDEPGVPGWLWPLYAGLILWAVYYVIRFFSQ